MLNNIKNVKCTIHKLQILQEMDIQGLASTKYLCLGDSKRSDIDMSQNVQITARSANTHIQSRS
jgi:hypothetical protein